MARSRQSAKSAGSRMERQVADYLAEALGNPDIDRAPKHGALDRGDVANVRDSHRRRVAVEVKNTTRMNLPAWTAEAQVEADNYGAHVGIVVSKRHGVGDPARQWVHMELQDLVKLLTKEEP